MGDWEKSETVQFGTIGVAEAGRQTVKIAPVKDGWAPLNLAWLEPWAR